MKEDFGNIRVGNGEVNVQICNNEIGVCISPTPDVVGVKTAGKQSGTEVGSHDEVHHVDAQAGGSVKEQFSSTLYFLHNFFWQTV